MKMPTIDNNVLILGGVGLATLAAVYLYGKTKTNSGGFFQTVGTGAGSAVVDLADGVISGGAIAIGDKLGVPRTNKTECELALERGGLAGKWEASFKCPAGTFIGSFF